MNVEALLATGDVDFNAKNSTFSATIPNTAQDEYQHTLAASTWTINGWTNGGTYIVNDVGMKGFLYVGDSFSTGAGGATLIGSAYVTQDVSVNTYTIYYDSTIGQGIKLSNQTITRSSWDEITGVAW